MELELDMIIFTKTFCGTGMRLIVCGLLFSVVTVRRCNLWFLFFNQYFDFFFNSVVEVVVVVELSVL